MTEIKYDKKVAFNRIRFDLLMNFLFYSVLIGVVSLGLSGFLHFDFLSIFIPSVFILFIYFGVEMYFNYLYVKTLKQSYTEHELRTEYKIILEHIDVARLQIVNNVNIYQGFIDKLFGIFRVRVNYGFGDDGYVHEFNFLTKEKAEEVAESVRVKTDLGVLLRKKQ